MHGAAKELIKELRAAKPDGRLRILIITARVQQAFSSMANVEELGGRIYSDEKLKGGLLVEEDFMVTQFESLIKFQHCKKWDLVIVDEIKSIASQATADQTNKQNLAMNNVLFRAFLQNADRTLLMDAHCNFDGQVRDFVESIFEPREIVAHCYNYSEMVRKVIIHDDKRVMIDLVINDVNAGNRIMMCFRSKSELEGVMKTLVLGCPYLAHAVFDGDSSAEHMSNFKKIDEFIEENMIALLAWTSKVKTKNTCD